jgi:hypothetical protein
LLYCIGQLVAHRVAAIQSLSDDADVGLGFMTTRPNFSQCAEGAYLLGKNGPDRKAKFDTFRALYKARSEAVHDGHVDGKLLARLPEIDAACAAAIIKLVNLQNFPDWDHLTLCS